jgi:hypothetical protein
MLEQAGIAVFVLGNKVGPSGDYLPADGMVEEFEISRNAGLLVVPAGATGYTPGVIHEMVSRNWKALLPDVSGMGKALSQLGPIPEALVRKWSGPLSSSPLRLLSAARGHSLFDAGQQLVWPCEKWFGFGWGREKAGEIQAGQQGRRVRSGLGLDHWPHAQDVDRAFEVVGQHREAHFHSHLPQPVAQAVGLIHPASCPADVGLLGAIGSV